MKAKKFILAATVSATLFALTVPASFACDKCGNPGCTTGMGCPIEKVDTCNKCKKEKPKCKCKKEKKCNKCKQTGCACPVKKEKCNKCKKAKPKCKCKQEKPKCQTCPSLDAGATTGQAASMSNVPKYKAQEYAYPAAVYSGANMAIVGEDNNGTAITDKDMHRATGVLVEDLNCTTGAAAPIIDETCGFAAPLPCDCKVDIQSPTSMQVKKKSYEPRTFEESGITGAAVGINGEYYPDVPDRFWAAPDINRLTCEDVVVGYPDGKFRPNRDISRAEMATMAIKGYKKEGTPLSEAGNFADVPEYHWAYENINKAATLAFLNGKANDMFVPNGKMTRIEALNVIGKGMDCPIDCEKAESILSQYTDGKNVPADMRENVAKAINAGALKHQYVVT